MALSTRIGARPAAMGAMLALATVSARAQFGAATGEVRLEASARYEIGGVPTVDAGSHTALIVFGMPATPIGLNADTPEANGGASVTIVLQPSGLLMTGSANANAWCDAPLESCGSLAETGLVLSFSLPHGGSYSIAAVDAFVQTSLRAHVLLLDASGAEVLRIEDEQAFGVTGVLPPGTYTIEAESVAIGEGEIPPHLGGYAAWSLAFEVTPAAPPCPGDADGDGAVTFGDVTAVLANFGSVGAISAPGDADGTGVVDFADVTTTLASFGADCG